MDKTEPGATFPKKKARRGGPTKHPSIVMYANALFPTTDSARWPRSRRGGGGAPRGWQVADGAAERKGWLAAESLFSRRNSRIRRDAGSSGGARDARRTGPESPPAQVRLAI